MIGIPIGFLIGIVTAAIFLVLLKTVHGAKISNTAAVLTIVSEIFSIPTFWFGGPWVATSFLKLVTLSDMINYYISTLAIVFGAVVIVPIISWIAQTTTALGKEG